ncbi:serine protease [Phytohabitans aurantiacus]|uniref:Serine protease n=1 Tax=Phytohabitans aurantiacus TaxID=3016789 RepID=A0ABQ5QV16_9ACTN|nr:serine protease [Phytohabitans aurantiacus]
MARQLRSVLILAASLITVTATAGPAGAEPPSGAVAPFLAPATVRQAHSLTLVTGDVVRLSTLADGRQIATADEGRGFQISQRNGDVYAVPHAAVPYVRSGQVDEALFNLTDLVAAGYHDEASDTLPLLVAGSGMKNLRGRELRSIGAVALDAEKDQARQYWNAVTAGQVRKVWLNRQVRATLDDSVPQIGAPAAWRSGYDGRGVKVAVLDSGYDPTHPALAGRVSTAANFTDEEDTVDRFGHGTHVAATVAGRGAAKGVAPGADLLVGKVLNGAGAGDLSWVIAGMEWAVSQGARIVNVSLGAEALEGPDPVTEAVDALTASSGALFVVAAGNSGSGMQTVTTPGTATSALTVGAVSKEDELAAFSGRGPRLGDGAVKPEITAPGVGIVAARAAGTGLGEVVSKSLTAMSGTSMATPHVAGAAALLAQRHPDWKAGQLKAALVASATPLRKEPLWAVGSGRVDVAAALDQEVVAEPAALTVNQDKAEVTYRNNGAKAVTLALSATAASTGATPTPASLDVTPSRLTVPAGEKVTATVRVGAGTPAGMYAGLLIARGGGQEVRTPVGVTKAAPVRTLTVEGVNHDGSAPVSWSNVMLWNLDSGARHYAHFGGNTTTTVEVPEGRYAMTGLLFVVDEEGVTREATVISEPELTISGDRTLRYDGRTATRLRVDTPRPATVAALGVVWQRVTANRSLLEGNSFTPETAVYAIASTGQASVGTFRLLTRWDLTGPGTAGEDYRYDLLFVEDGRVPADLRQAATGLATVESEFHGHGVELRARDTRSGFVDGMDLALGFSRPVERVGVRTDYVSTRGVTWRHEVVQELDFGWGRKGGMHQLSRAYKASERVREVWFGALVRPALPETGADYVYGAPVNRAHDAIRVAVPQYADGAVGQYGWLDYRSDRGRLTLRRGNTVIGDTTLPYTQFTVPGREATYRLTLDVARDRFTDDREWWTTSTATSTTWTFRSGRPGGDKIAVLPLLQIGYDISTDLSNTVVARWAYKMKLDLGYQPGYDRGGRIAADVRVSYDDGAHWRAVPTTGGRSLTATVPAAPPGAEFATIRVIATDGAGNRIDQTITRAWKVKR